jgi:flagellin
MSSLVVNTNLSAIETLNDLNVTDTSLTTAVNRLSSGLQIASAATGPAQYVISQALESQANGYGTAISNAQDGVSLIQTASGALTQISSILQTMEQLALTSANSATQTSTSLAANQSEFTDLLTSIDEIAKTTTFGTTNLLIGNVTATTHPTGTPSSAYTGELQVGAFDLVDQQITLSVSAVTSQALGLSGGAAVAASTAITGGKVTFKAATTLKFTVGTASYAVKIAAGTHTLAAIATAINAAAGNVVKATASTSVLTLQTVATGTSAKLKVTALKVKTAATATVTVFKAALTKTGTATGKTQLTSSVTAQKAIKAVSTALSKVDAVASNVGAIQSELQAFVSNLTVGQQNLQAADSQLVDVNMAQEMTTYSTDQILMQSGISMLAQAQQLPSLVLKLMS